MEKYKMYVSVVNQQVYHHPDDSPWEYEVEVAREYVPIFDRLFIQVDQIEYRNFLKSHLPLLRFQDASGSEDVDNRMMKIYALIHEFTDTKSKQFIEKLPYFR
ncbi:transposase [Sporosarcina sp. NPDC096371]|uniref:transposase n=1 Tax=Sporosarcina sp. NPDC096371 TaxID=3364530 RepID=UPI0038124E65